VEREGIDFGRKGEEEEVVRVRRGGG
jgi:hypothetical protein